jgi:hypothetical protein
MHFARSLALVVAAVIATPAAAADCRMGTNMPAGDANPAKPIDAGQARMVCQESVLVSRARDGSTQQMRTWKFEPKK